MILNFDDVFYDSTKNGTKIKTNLYNLSGLYPIIDQGQDQIAGYFNNENGVFKDVPAIIFGDHTRIIKYIDEPFFIGADGVKILKCKFPNANYKYLYYLLKNVKIQNTGYNRHFKWLKEIKVYYPNLDEQNRIVEVLDKVSNIINLRKQQLEKYDTLIKARFIEMFGDGMNNDGRYKLSPISKIGTVVSGATPNTNQDEYWNGENLWITPAELSDTSFIVKDSVRKITDLGVKSCGTKLLPKGTIILSSRAPIGKVAIAGVPMYCNQGFKNIIPNEYINSIYLYVLLSMKTEFLNSLGRGATFKEISKQIVEKIKIKVPPLDPQNQFADFVKQVNKSKVVVQKSLDNMQQIKLKKWQNKF